MNVLFIHDAFPAQFGRLALELSRRHGWKCSFLVQSLSSCPTPSPEMLQAVELHLVPKSAEHRTSEGIPWPQIYGHYLDQCQTIHDTIRAMPHLQARPGRRPRRPRSADAVPARGARLPDHHLLRILLREQPSRHLVSDRPAAGRARAVLPALHQRADPGGPGRLRRRIFGDALAEAVVSGAISIQDRGSLRWHRHGALPARAGASSDWCEVDSARYARGHVCFARAGVDSRVRPVHERGPAGSARPEKM